MTTTIRAVGALVSKVLDRGETAGDRGTMTTMMMVTMMMTMTATTRWETSLAHNSPPRAHKPGADPPSREFPSTSLLADSSALSVGTACMFRVRTSYLESSPSQNGAKPSGAKRGRTAPRRVYNVTRRDAPRRTPGR